MAVKFRLDVIVIGNPHLTYFGALAQLGERLSGRQKVKGSIPLGSTKTMWPRRLVARIPPFQGEEAGSKPVGATIKLYPCRLMVRQSADYRFIRVQILARIPA